jgi:four helix bundle protein
MARQILRSATSCGANYEEACGAESRADFIHKMQVVLKELRETLYWLRLIAKSFPSLAEHLQIELREADELVRIFSKSVITAKRSA